MRRLPNAKIAAALFTQFHLARRDRLVVAFLDFLHYGTRSSTFDRTYMPASVTERADLEEEACIEMGNPVLFDTFPDSFCDKASKAINERQCSQGIYYSLLCVKCTQELV